MIACFIIGAPGVGKTTLVRALLGMDEKGGLPNGGYIVTKPKWTVTPHLVAAGHYNGGTFDGADMVPYNGVNEALDYFDREFARFRRPVIFDGDRFSNQGVYHRLKETPNVEVTGLHLHASPALLDERRAKRGSTQNASWMKGRETKSSRFAALIGAPSLNVDRRFEDLVASAKGALDLP